MGKEKMHTDLGKLSSIRIYEKLNSKFPFFLKF